MGALDPRVTRALDELAPPRPEPDRWDAIVGAAGAARRGRRRLVAAVPIAGAALAAAVLALAWPFGSGPQGTILERAAAAVGDGPVLHAVVRVDLGLTVVDLDTGARRKMYAEAETWYDPARGLHDLMHIDGSVVGEVLRLRRNVKLDEYLAVVATDYRESLRDGSARVVEEGAVEGEAVYWIRVATRTYYALAGGKPKLRESADDVAVSQDTFDVVATRSTLDGELQPGSTLLVLEIETLPAGEGNFTRVTDEPASSARVTEDPTSLTPTEASAALGRPALWAGRRVAGLELARVWKEVVREQIGTEPGKEYVRVRFFYGTLGERGRPGHSPPLVGGRSAPKPYVWITESLELDLGRVGWFGVPWDYVPAESSMLLAGRVGALYVDGVYVGIEASSEELLLAAARSLEPVPAG